MNPIYYLVKDAISGTLSFKTLSPSLYPQMNEVLSLYKEGNDVASRTLRNRGYGKLLEDFDYSIALDQQYSSYIYHCKDEESISCDRIKSRMDAWSYMDALNKIKRNTEVVAYSHRYGGWTGINWQFNDEINFLISTNFGYGMSSYFYSSVKYKEIQLCPFSDYIKYRNQSVGTTLAHTFSYCCKYKEWEKCLKDAMEIYNAVVYKKEYAIFERLTSELNDLVRGLNRMARFEGIHTLYANGSISGYAEIGEDDYIIACSDKMAHAIEFIKAIKILPEQIRPSTYITSIVESCKGFVPYLERKIEYYSNKQEEKNNLLSQENRNLDNFYKLYPIIKLTLDKVKPKRYRKGYRLYSDIDFHKYCKSIILRKIYGHRDLKIEEHNNIQELENYFLNIIDLISKLYVEISHITQVIKLLESNHSTLTDNIESVQCDCSNLLRAL